MARLILEYRGNHGVTRIERDVRADRLNIAEVERKHVSAALTVAAQQLIAGSGASGDSGPDPAKAIAAAIHKAAAEVNPDIPGVNDRYWLRLADAALEEIDLIR